MSILSRRLATLTDRQMSLLDRVSYGHPLDRDMYQELDTIKNTLNVETISEAVNSYIAWLDEIADETGRNAM